MNTLTGIIIHPKKTFEYLNNQYVDFLENRSNIIFLCISILAGIKSLIEENKYIEDKETVLIIVLFIITIALGFVICRYLLTYTIFGIGKLLKAKIELVDLRVVVSYSMIPNILISLIFILLELTSFSESFFEYKNLIFISLSIFIWLLTFNIMIKGLGKYNEYGLFKAFINVIPFIIFGIYVYTRLLLSL